MPSPVVVQKHIGFVLQAGQSAKILVVDNGTGAILKETPVYHHAVYAKKERRHDLWTYGIIGVSAMILLVLTWGAKVFESFAV